MPESEPNPQVNRTKIDEKNNFMLITDSFVYLCTILKSGSLQNRCGLENPYLSKKILGTKILNRLHKHHIPSQNLFAKSLSSFVVTSTDLNWITTVAPRASLSSCTYSREKSTSKKLLQNYSYQALNF